MAARGRPPLAQDRVGVHRRVQPRDPRSTAIRDVRGRDSPAVVNPLSASTGQTPADSLEDMRGVTPARIPPSRGRPPGRVVLTIGLLLFGGLAVPVVGWVAGSVLLWTSAEWRRRDKIIGTLVVPGGLGSLLLPGVRHAPIAVAAAVLGSLFTSWWLDRRTRTALAPPGAPPR